MGTVLLIFIQSEKLPISAVRGQVSHISTTPDIAQLKAVLLR